MRSSIDPRIRFAAATVLVGVIASGGLGLAQGSEDRAIDQAQRAVSERITSQEGGRDLTVQPSNTNIRVRGTDSVTRGSVFFQGRDDLELANGTEFVIRASAPR